MSKKYKLIALLLLFFGFSNSFAQDKTIPTNSIQKDTIKINTIITAMENVAGWSKEYIALYTQLQPLFVKGLQVKNLNSKVKDKYIDAAGVYYYNVAKKETQDGDDKALKHFDEAIKFWKQSNDTKDIVQALVGKGTFYLRIPDYPNTYKCYFEALKYSENNKDEEGIASVNQEIGGAYMTQFDWKNGVIYLKKALDFYNKKSKLSISDRHELAVLYNNMGVCHTRLKNLNEAHENYLKAYEYIKLNKDEQSESIVLVQLANSANDLGRVSEAQSYLDKALELSKDEFSKTAIYGNAARIYYKNKDYEKAAEYGRKNYSMSKKAKDVRAMLGMSGLLTKIYKESDQYKEALLFAQTSATLKDSINNMSSKNELEQQKLKYDFEKKELNQKIEQEKKISDIKLNAQEENARQETENKLAQQLLKYNFEKKALKQRINQQKKVSAIKLDNQKIKLKAQKDTAIKNNWLFGLSGMLLLLSLSGYFYYRNNKQKQAIAVFEKNQIKQKLLITQMNPHFIFNSIDNIQGLIYDKKDKEAVNYLTKFSKLTRQILENSTENYISLAEEIEMIENYLIIQQLLYNNKFEFKIDIEEAIDIETILLPPMLMQPFIENAIKHGLNNKTENGKIDISFYLNNDKLFFNVSDNGTGFDASKKSESHKSLAINITKERLINYTKNQDFIIQTDNIIDKNGNSIGAKVIFEIPYIYEK